MNNTTTVDLEAPDFDKNDPEFQNRRPCRHVSGDPDCDCNPDDFQEDETGEAGMAENFAEHEADELIAEEVVAETLPAVLTAAQVTERELRRLEKYRSEILNDVTDPKAAKAIDAKRLEVKRARTTATRICKEQREEAIKVQKGWVAVERGVAERLQPIEDHLEREANRHSEWKAEQDRKAEAARILRIKTRVEQVVAVGAPLNMADVETMSDEAWAEHIEAIAATVAFKAKAKAIADELTALSDECTAEEAEALTDEQADHRLTVARKADSDRKEGARIKAEEEVEAKRKADAEAQAKRDEQVAQERAARERLERGANRMRELALLGSPADMEALADMTNEAYAVAITTATEDKRHRDTLAAQERQRQADRDAELARLQQQEADRQREQADEQKRIEREARETAEKAEREAKEAREAAEAEEAAQKERDRLEALRPEREKIAAWARQVLDGMPSTPEITDADLLLKMRQTVIAIREALLDLEEVGN